MHRSLSLSQPLPNSCAEQRRLLEAERSASYRLPEAINGAAGSVFEAQVYLFSQNWQTLYARSLASPAVHLQRLLLQRLEREAMRTHPIYLMLMFG